MMVDNERRWVEYETFEKRGDDFKALGKAYENAYSIVLNQIAQAEVRLFEQRTIVDFGVKWIEENRGQVA